MDKIRTYLADNPQYVTALIITAALLVFFCILGYVIKKFDLLRFMDGWFKKKPENNSDPNDSQAEDTESNSVKPTEAEAEKTYGEYGAASGDEEAKISSEDDRPFEFAPEEGALKKEDGTMHPASEPAPQPELTRGDGASPAPGDENPTENAADDVDIMAIYTMEKSRQKSAKPLRVEEIEKRSEREIQVRTGNMPQVNGQWRILRAGNTFAAKLFGSGETPLIESPHYSAYSGARKAVDNLKKNIEGNNFSIAVDRNGKYYFKLFSLSGRLISTGAPCKNRDECEKMISEIKRIAFDAEIIRG